MIDASLKRMARALAKDLLGAENDVAFGQLIQRDLTVTLWGAFKLLFDPLIGGKLHLGTQSFHFTPGMPDNEELRRLNSYIQGEYYLDEKALTDLMVRVLNVRYRFILDPVRALRDVMTERTEGHLLKGREWKAALDAMEKLLTKWDPEVRQASATVESYLFGLGDEPIDGEQFERLLRSAFEKNLSSDPITATEKAFMELESLFKQDDDFPVGEFDFSEMACAILRSRGLGSWVGVIEVERLVEGGILSLHSAIDAIRRMQIYRDQGLLGIEQEELAEVEAEVDEFSDFVKELTS